MALKEDYKDATFSGLRKYKNVDNGDGTVSMVDVTEYAEAGDKFGAKDVNAMTKMINNTGDDFNEGQDYVAGDYAVHDNKVWKFTSPHPAGPWDESHVKATTIAKELSELSEKMGYYDLTKSISDGHVELKESYKKYRFLVFEINSLLPGYGTYIGSSCILSSLMIRSGNNMVRVPYYLAELGYFQLTNFTDTGFDFTMAKTASSSWLDDLWKVYGVL